MVVVVVDIVVVTDVVDLVVVAAVGGVDVNPGNTGKGYSGKLIEMLEVDVVTYKYVLRIS